jgi:hypothetical protein
MPQLDQIAYLALAPSNEGDTLTPAVTATSGGTLVRYLLLLLYLPICLTVAPSQRPPATEQTSPGEVEERVPSKLLTLFAGSPGSAFPAPPPWLGLYFLSQRDDTIPLPDAAGLERLARENPIAFLEACIRRYQRTVHGYHCALDMQEYLDGSLHDPVKVEVCFREKPFSVFMNWLEGGGRVARALYVKGENDDKVRFRTRVLGLVMSRDPEGREARQTGRYTIKEFGIKKGMDRTLDSWHEAARHDALHITYLGEQRIAEVGDRPCYVLKRAPYAHPEEDGILELTIYIDKETWLQVGSVLRGEGSRLVGEYYFRDVELNPDFGPDQFTESVLH